MILTDYLLAALTVLPLAAFAVATVLLTWGKWRERKGRSRPAPTFSLTSLTELQGLANIARMDRIENRRTTGGAVHFWAANSRVVYDQNRADALYRWPWDATRDADSMFPC